MTILIIVIVKYRGTKPTWPLTLSGGLWIAFWWVVVSGVPYSLDFQLPLQNPFVAYPWHPLLRFPEKWRYCFLQVALVVFGRWRLFPSLDDAHNWRKKRVKEQRSYLKKKKHLYGAKNFSGLWQQFNKIQKGYFYFIYFIRLSTGIKIYKTIHK